MAVIEKLQEKVTAAADRVEKSKKTILRHEAQLEKKLGALDGPNFTPWDMYAIDHKRDDIKGATKKLAEAERILAGWQAKLNVELEKERFLNEQAPAVIVKFLNEWKEQAREWYIRSHARYLVLRGELAAAKKAAEQRFRVEHPEVSAWGRVYNNYMKADESIVEISTKIAMMGNAVQVMATYREEEERLAWLEKTLEQDKRAKMLDLVQRINAVVGTITDASSLQVSAKGNLDGFIVGEKGKARIETISAGGYNIQCFHYRTLVHPIK